jgi:hypothetical protein
MHIFKVVVLAAVCAAVAALSISNATAQGWSPKGGATSCDAAFASGHQAGYSAGAAAGQTAGFDSGFNSGYATAHGETLATCQSSPNTCGIYLGACLAAPQYGETEPNDNIVTADPLLLDTKFWGQASIAWTTATGSTW